MRKVPRLIALAPFFFSAIASGAGVPPLVCSSGGPVGIVDLRVASPQGGDKTLPLRTINRLGEGDELSYRPVLRGHEERKGDVDLVLVPAEGVTSTDRLVVLDAKSAAQPQRWKVPWRVGLVAFVYGPQGLSVHKVRGFLAKDDEIVGELADYAEKTTKTEALLAELSSPNVSSERFEGAMEGFSSQFGLNVQLSRTAPTDQQAMTLFQALNPAIASYDPLAPQPTASARQAATLATSVAGLFFGSPVGLAAGGTALLLSLRSLAFPNSAFRSSFSQAIAGDALGLCGQTGSAPAHTRIAYLWATRVPNVGPPPLKISKANSLPAGLKSPLPVETPEATWKVIDRAHDWTLQPQNGKAVPVKVAALNASKELELDLKGVAPGRYTLHADWDWDHFEADGSIDVRAIGDFQSAHVPAPSQDGLVAKTGKIVVTLDAGEDDFEFVTKVQIEKLHDEFASPSTVPFVLPKGLRNGVQKQMDVQVDTSGLDPGDYKLTLSQVDGSTHDIGMQVLPPAPMISGLPLVVSEGSPQAQFVLKGERLDLLKDLELAKGTAQLDQPVPGATSRTVTLRMPPDVKAGNTFALLAHVEGRSQPLTFPDAVRIGTPRPVITDASVGRPGGQSVQLASDELPGGVPLTALFHIEHLETGSVLKLSCDGAPRAGGLWRTQQVAANQLFLTFDTGGWPSGCTISAVISNGSEGESEPYILGRLVLLPKIDNIELTALDDGSGSLLATLTGENLETIEKAGWAADQGQPTLGLPLPAAGGQKQQLQIRMPAPPSPGPALYLWLRNEQKPRLTLINPTPPQ